MNDETRKALEQAGATVMTVGADPDAPKQFGGQLFEDVLGPILAQYAQVPSARTPGQQMVLALSGSVESAMSMVVAVAGKSVASMFLRSLANHVDALAPEDPRAQPSGSASSTKTH